MRDLTNANIRHRIAGRARLEQRLQRLYLQVHRFAEGRARSPEETRLAAAMLDALARLLAAEGRDEVIR